MRSVGTWSLTVAGIICAFSGATVLGQVNSGSDGHDGALNPTSNVIIDMHDHPDGIYQYTSVSIPSGVTVSFIPNDANTPVVWLVQESCTIAGTVDVKGKTADSVVGAPGGPGGYRGGNGSPSDPPPDPGPGLGPGGGKVTPGSPWYFMGGNASYGTGPSGTVFTSQHPSGELYGNAFLLPLIGGSGGGGSSRGWGGCGGGGAILIAVSNSLTLSGTIQASGGGGTFHFPNSSGGGGSGGAVRLVATVLTGSGSITTSGGQAFPSNCCNSNVAGIGRIRLEAQSNTFVGGAGGVRSDGFAGIILLPANQNPSLTITSVGGVAVPAGAVGSGAPVDVIIPAQQSNPMTVQVACNNIPLNSDIVVEVRPLSGSIVTATGQNTTGTTASSTATISLNLPSGEGYISARTTTNLILSSAQGARDKRKKASLFETGLAANGERFKAAEIKTVLGRGQEVVLVTESGKRFPLPGSGRAVKSATTRPS